VTKLAGAVTMSQAFLPQRVSEFLGRALGAESAFTAGVDPAARQAYEERARSV
jgi:hypothetical protein